MSKLPKDMEIEERCKLAWNNLMISLNLNAFNRFDEILALYNQDGRYYHTIKHIDELLLLLNDYRNNLNEPLTVELAIWFHDIIYDVRKKDNELQSARYFEEFAIEVGLSMEIVRNVVEMILATEAHTVDEDASLDTKYFLDFDLSILAASEDRYDKYAADIRKEYEPIASSSAFNQGRLNVLQSFCYRSPLFLTPDCNERFGNIAIANINREIQMLKSLLS